MVFTTPVIQLSQKMLDMDLMYPIVIKITKTKIKAMLCDLSSYAASAKP